jgi:hypothetical protein
VLKELGVRLIRTFLAVEGRSRVEVKRMLQAFTVAAEESGTRALARSIALVTKAPAPLTREEMPQRPYGGGGGFCQGKRPATSVVNLGTSRQTAPNVDAKRWHQTLKRCGPIKADHNLG